MLFSPNADELDDTQESDEFETDSTQRIESQGQCGEIERHDLAEPAKIDANTGSLILNDPKANVALASVWHLLPENVMIKFEKESQIPRNGMLCLEYRFVIQNDDTQPIPLGTLIHS